MKTPMENLINISFSYFSVFSFKLNNLLSYVSDLSSLVPSMAMQ